MKHIKSSAAALFIGLSASFPAQAFFLDGNGHYGLIGETQVAPEFQKDRGTYQATRISFDLNGEVRANDRASFNLRLGLGEDTGHLYLGDSAKPKSCERRRSPDGDIPATDDSCDGRSQSAIDSGYSSMIPIIREAYVKYAFNYCIVTAGRRSRDVGIGAFINSGKRPFDTDASIFDGITCDVNMQKHQDLGFTFGIDRLQETGVWIDNPYDSPVKDGEREAEFGKRSRKFGANSAGDDMDQLFFGITYDDLKTKSPGSFAKQVSIYFSNILSGDTKTDVKFFDLYTGFYFGKFSLKNELIFRLGKTADPAVVAMGGKRSTDEATITNNVNSMAVAGKLEYTIHKSGAALGPEEFNEGNLRRHVLFADYAYAPGDSDGYYVDSGSASEERNQAIGEAKRGNNRASALALHKNFRPALLFFNGRSTSRDTAVGGVYNPERIMNATIYSLGYRYENMEAGNFEIKLISGRLLETAPSDLVSYLNSGTETSRPMGFYGSDLGYELDLMYTYQYQREVELSIGAAAANPGKAWKMSSTQGTQMGLGLLTSFAVKF
jgi:hypothetical protein